MKVLNVFLHQHSSKEPLHVGRLAYKSGQTLFEYEGDFVKNGLTISPLQLPLQAGLQTADRQPFNGLHGVFADSLPDGWGLLLMDRIFRQRQIDLQIITPLDRLAYIGHRAMGALVYEPAMEEELDTHCEQLLSLNILANEALRIYQGEASEVLQELAVTGGSPGGARPKILIGLNNNHMISGAEDLPTGYAHWIVKFPTGTTLNARYEGVVEYLYSILARRAKINFPETQLFSGNNSSGYFAIKRFDRGDNNQRIHMHSLAGMLNADFRTPDCDYETLIKATSVITKHHGDSCEAFRRMVFNIISGNRDDHTKNFSYLMDDHGEWRLSPAYDITFSQGIHGQHTMSVKGQGKDISLEAILAIADLIPLEKKKAVSMIKEIIDAVSSWDLLAKEYDLPDELKTEVSAYIHASCARLMVNLE